MPMTVRRLAATTSLGLTIVAGHDDVDLSISWAHAIELQDPTRWLAGGELVMTTGLHLPRSATKQYEYVERIAQTGAVALAFDTGTVHERVPDAIIRAGDELGFAVLSVAKETPFIAISRERARIVRRLRNSSALMLPLSPIHEFVRRDSVPAS